MGRWRLVPVLTGLHAAPDLARIEREAATAVDLGGIRLPDLAKALLHLEDA